jgi:hypothetical protein
VAERWEERARRLGENEAVFREVNERIDEIGGTFYLSVLDVICECGDASCAQRLEVTREEYEAWRSDATLFGVVPGHELPDVEDVVEEREAYNVVKKKPGVPEDVARETAAE